MQPRRGADAGSGRPRRGTFIAMHVVRHGRSSQKLLLTGLAYRSSTVSPLYISNTGRNRLPQELSLSDQKRDWLRWDGRAK
jgi:hypothetical protein